MSWTDIIIIVVSVFVGCGIFLLVRWVQGQRRFERRGFLAVVEDGPDQGTMVAISRDHPVVVLRLTDSKGDPLRAQDLGVGAR